MTLIESKIIDGAEADRELARRLLRACDCEVNLIGYLDPTRELDARFKVAMEVIEQRGLARRFGDEIVSLVVGQPIVLGILRMPLAIKAKAALAVLEQA